MPTNPSPKSVAAAAGVSVSWVSNAYNQPELLLGECAPVVAVTAGPR